MKYLMLKNIAENVKTQKNKKDNHNTTGHYKKQQKKDILNMMMFINYTIDQEKVMKDIMLFPLN